MYQKAIALVGWGRNPQSRETLQEKKKKSTDTQTKWDKGAVLIEMDNFNILTLLTLHK